MCVDDIELSAYIDEELSSEREQQVRAHIEECERCRARVASLRTLSGFVSTLQIPETETKTRMERSRKKIAVETERNPDSSLWRRRVSISVPIAAAAMLFFLFIGGVLAILSGLGRSSPGQELRVVTPRESTMGADAFFEEADNDGPSEEDMEKFLRYIAEGKSSSKVMIDLPKTSSFTVHGEPRLMKASELSGSGGSSPN